MKVIQDLLWQILDLLACIWVLPRILFLALSTPKSTTTHSVRLLRVIEGGSLEGMYRKYNHLDLYFNHLIPGTTELVVGALFETPNAFEIRLRDNYVLCEIKYSKMTPFYSSLQCICKLIQLIKKYNLNLIHSNTPFSQGLAAWIAAKITRRPFVFSLHSDYFKRESLKLGSTPRTLGSLKLSYRIFAFLCKRADAIIPIRKSMVPSLLKYGADADKIFIFPHGIDLTLFQSNIDLDVHQQLHIPRDALIISSACRLVRDNYTQDLLKLADQLDPIRKGSVAPKL